MEYVYAAMLIHSAGEEINEDSVANVMESAGFDVDDSQVKALVAALEDVDIDEAMSQAAAAPAPAAGGGAGGASEEAAEEEADEEEEEEDEEADEEEAAEGLGELFG